MRYHHIALVLLPIFAVFACPASADCSQYTFDTSTIVNGQSADATRVANNFNYLKNCPNFTGNVGIGTATPASKLDVLGPAGSALAIFETPFSSVGMLRFGPGTGVAFLKWDNSTGTLGSSNALQLVAGYGSIGFNNGTGSADAMRIGVNGSVGIGTTTPSYTLHVNGSVAGVGAYNNLSDERLKKNIMPIPDALTKIEALRGVEFDWRRPSERAVGKNLNLPTGSHQIGFIAQEVRRVVPEAVTVAQGREHLMSTEESKVVPLLVEAVKALKAANDRQGVEISDLRKQVAELRRQATTRTASR